MPVLDGFLTVYKNYSNVYGSIYRTKIELKLFIRNWIECTIDSLNNKLDVSLPRVSILI